MKQIVVLGATGSIGLQTLDVVRALPDRLTLHGLSAHSRWQKARELAHEFRPCQVVLTDESARGAVNGQIGWGGAEVLWGESGIEKMVAHPAVDTVVAAMVGSAGLRGAIAALKAGKTLALANKETLVAAGALVTSLAKSKKCAILPVDSEHSAVFQCLQVGQPREVSRIILTASGGPFRETPIEHFADITVAEALRHPTWSMGPKITIDSATMMNKALEIIEAHWLFGLPAAQIEVTIHPQSMVHSLVEFVDGSVLAQVAPPDMRLPIQYALTYPARWPGPARRFDYRERGRWDFEVPDPRRYPALQLGYAVVQRGGTAGAALNAANETAVARFLNREITFPQIVMLCEQVLHEHPYHPNPDLSAILRVDQWAREEAKRWNTSNTCKPY